MELPYSKVAMHNCGPFCAQIKTLL